MTIRLKEHTLIRARTKRALRTIALSVLLTISFAFPLSSAGQGPPSVRAAFLVRLGEGVMNLSRDGVSEHDCLLVLPDGHFHLERRTQLLPSPRAKLKIFESALPAPQFQRLREILAQESIEKLPADAPPAFPMSVPWSKFFGVEIPRGTGVQKAGYWLWTGGTPETSPNSMPENIKQEWKESEIVLQPLVEWFHELEATKLRRHGKSTLCHMPGEPDPSLVQDR